MTYRKDLHNIIEPAVQAVGYQLYACEYITGDIAPILRVYIETSQGVSLDDCAKASRQIDAILNVEDPIRGRYILEVSSPGITRRLYSLAHYQRYIEAKVAVKLSVPLAKRRVFIGTLKSANELQIELALEDEELVCLPIDKISKANLVVKNSVQLKPKKQMSKLEKK